MEETPPPPTVEDVRLTVKKLEAGTNQPLAGATFKIEGVGSDFSVTKTTGADGTITLTKDADNLLAGQYRITETSAPAGYTIQNASQVVTVMPDSAASSVFTFYKRRALPIPARTPVLIPAPVPVRLPQSAPVPSEKWTQITLPWALRALSSSSPA